jgi:hypothetical protein
MRIGPERTRAGLDTCQLRTPIWALSKALGPHCRQSGPHTGGGPDPILGVRSVHVGVLDGSWTNLEVRTVYPGVRCPPMGSEFTVDILENITFSRHMAVLDPPM